ncbi:hypothetical protein LguiB_036351 [Lonicera macranthoides]
MGLVTPFTAIPAGIDDPTERRKEKADIEGGIERDIVNAKLGRAPTTTRKRPYTSNEGSGSQTGEAPSTAPIRPSKYPVMRNQSLPRSQGGPSTASPTIPPRRNVRRKENVPNGYGVYISEQTGNTFVRLPGKQGSFYQANNGPAFTKQASGSEVRSSKSPNKRTPTKRVNPTTGVASNTRSKTPTKEPVASATRSKATKNLGLTRAWQI